MIVYHNCDAVAVASGACEALKRWAAGLHRLEGGCAANGSIIHWLLCILFWSETHIDFKGKMGAGRKTAHCLKKHVAFMYFISWPRSRGKEEAGEEIEREGWRGLGLIVLSQCLH